jgi:succinate dehydrogenase flavin-adding protein (antitoxin of CptAB toxin-antitoxin module)
MQDAMQPIAEKLKEMKFRKKLFGVDEADVWRQLESLQQEYQKVYDAQAAYYQALLDERDQAVARLMRRRGAEPHE